MDIPISPADLITQENGAAYHLGLLPEQVTDIILTVGDPERVSAVSQHFDVVEEKVAKREFVTHIGRIGHLPLMVISSGMGTDNVEILMNELDVLVNIDPGTRTAKSARRSLTIIRLGTSGSLQPDIPLDSLLVSETAFGLDTLMQFYRYETPEKLQEAVWGMKERFSLEFTPYGALADNELLKHFHPLFLPGSTLTCPGFYAPQGRSIRLLPRQEHLLEAMIDYRFSGNSITNMEMETAGYYALGRLLSHRMLSLNAILAHRPSGRFSSNPAKTVNLMIEQALSIISSL
uniref:Uridine phosphorylase n=1 Tax=Roseihalotalea indica TaxID=2867963 RepID=A0AA49GKU0_9BACT|nr:nucleoside phosphorylase [Tunicatimonas sp. TK19036]